MASRAAIACGLLLLALSLSACQDREEAVRRHQVQKQIETVDRQVKEIKAGHDELQDRVNNLRRLLAQADTELAKSNAEVFGINSIIPYLRELTTYGYGETPVQYIARNPDLGPGVLIPVLVLLFFLWAMWRIRQGQLQSGINQEIERVIRNLSADAAARATAAAPGPRPAPRPAPQPGRPTPESGKAPDTPAPAGKAAPQKSAAPAPSGKPAPRRAAATPREAKSGAASVAGARQGSARARKPSAASRKTARSKAGPAAVKKCKVKGCNNKHRSKGFCNKHYQQWRKGALREEIEED